MSSCVNQLINDDDKRELLSRRVRSMAAEAGNDVTEPDT